MLLNGFETKCKQKINRTLHAKCMFKLNNKLNIQFAAGENL